MASVLKQPAARSIPQDRRTRHRRYSTGYLVRRIGLALITVFLAANLDFLLPRLAGGNPAEFLASSQALGSAKVAKALEQQFGLGGSIWHQYASFLGQLLHGNLGISYEFYPESVSSVLAAALPYTVGLVFSATVLSYLVGWLLGVIGAWRQRSRFDELTVGVSFFLHGLPYFWTGMMLLFVFSFILGWFPDGHAFAVASGDETVLQVIGDALYHGILPVASLVVSSIAGHLLIMRNNTISVLREDYVMLARAKGLPVWKLVFKYTARTAMLPSFTGLMLALGTVVSGAIVTEEVFSYPGVGLVTYNAILNHDYPLIQGAFLVIALVVIAMNLLADLLYPLLDPRVSSE